MRDYDGFVSAWNNFGIFPEKHQKYVDFILKHTEGPIVELGGGNGLIAARLSEQREVILVGRQQPIAVGNYTFHELDGNSDEFMQLLTPETALAGRRSLCLFYSPPWMEAVEDRGVQTIVSQALEGEIKQVFQNAEMEAAMPQRRGWKVEREDPFLAAKRQGLVLLRV